MNKQLRIVLFENGTTSAQTTVNSIADELAEEFSIVNIYSKEPVKNVLPVRAIPNVGVLMFADTIEESEEILNIIKEISLYKKQDTLLEIIEEILTTDPILSDELEEKIASTIYGG